MSGRSPGASPIIILEHNFTLRYFSSSLIGYSDFLTNQNALNFAPSLVVMGRDLCTRGSDFESQNRIVCSHVYVVKFEAAGILLFNKELLGIMYTLESFNIFV